MVEKVEVNVKVCPDTAERIHHEIRRQQLVEAFSRLLHTAADEGFSLCLADPEDEYEDMRDKAMFSDTILIPPMYFIKD